MVTNFEGKDKKEEKGMHHIEERENHQEDLTNYHQMLELNWHKLTKLRYMQCVIIQCCSLSFIAVRTAETDGDKR